MMNANTTIDWASERETTDKRGLAVNQDQVRAAARIVTFVLLVAYCVCCAGALVLESPRLLYNPWENQYFESPQTYAAIYAAQTGKLYIPMSQPPYTLQAYAPLYYAINACVARAAHLDIDRFIFDARLMSYVAFLLCGLMVFVICRATSISVAYSALAGLMMLGQAQMCGWTVTPRPDMLLILAMLISLYCAVRWVDRVFLGYGLAGFFAGIAFLIKQPGAAVAVAIFAVLVRRKEFMKAAVLTISTIVPIAITFSILYRRHDPFFQQMSFVAKSYWSMKSAFYVLYTGCLTAYWIVPIAIGVIGFICAVKLDAKAKMIASFALVNFLVGLSGLPQLGAWTHYLFPSLAGCALLLPYAVESMRTRLRRIAWMAVASAALALAAWTGCFQIRDMVNFMNRPPQASVDWLRPYRVLSDVTTMNLHGSDPNLLDPFAAHLLELTGDWDPAPLVEGLKRGDYDLIIITHAGIHHVMPSFRGISYLGPQEINIIDQRYDVLCSSFTSLVLKPKGRDIAATPEMFGEMLGQRCGIGYRRFPTDLKISPDAR
jgi:hypothetical protein